MAAVRTGSGRLLRPQRGPRWQCLGAGRSGGPPGTRWWGWRSDAEQGERAGGGPSGPADPLGDVAMPGRSEQADRQVAQAGHHLRAVPGTDLGAVLVEGDVAHPVEPI